MPLGRWGQALGLGRLAGEEILWWVALAICLGYVVWIEHRQLGSIGFRPPHGLDLGIAAGAAVVAVIGIVAISVGLIPALGLHLNTAVNNRILATPFGYRVLLVTRAAVVEETLFRGYGIERLQQWSGSTWVAGVLSWAAFTIAHLASWGWAQLLVAGFAGAILTLLYLWRRNLWANMLTHWLTDAAGFLLVH